MLLYIYTHQIFLCCGYADRLEADSRWAIILEVTHQPLKYAPTLDTFHSTQKYSIYIGLEPTRGRDILPHRRHHHRLYANLHLRHELYGATNRHRRVADEDEPETAARTQNRVAQRRGPRRSRPGRNQPYIKLMICNYFRFFST